MSQQATKHALKTILASRQAIETLIDKTPFTDEYTLSMLGLILCELRSAQRPSSDCAVNNGIIIKTSPVE